MRELGVWTYAIVNLAHVLGVALLFGAIFVLDARLLGMWRGVAIEQLSRPIVRVAGAGFLIAVSTGVGLLATNATEYDGNPFLLIKFAAIFLGLLNILIVHALPAWKHRGNPALPRAQRRHLALAGGTSLACWLLAVSAGRMIAYW